MVVPKKLRLALFTRKCFTVKTTSKIIPLHRNSCKDLFSKHVKHLQKLALDLCNGVKMLAFQAGLNLNLAKGVGEMIFQAMNSHVRGAW